MKKDCKLCGMPFTTKPSHVSKRVFCSRSCRGQYESKFKSGTNSPHYKAQETRFWSKVQKTDGCWLWAASKTKYGYGCFGGRNNDKAHRVAYELTYGSIPAGLFVCHHCDNPSCVRPDHLFVGTNNDNVQDSVRKGRRRGAPLEKNWVHLHPEAVRGENNVNAKISSAQVKEIREAYKPRKVTRKMLAAKYGLHKSHIDRIIAGTVWNSVDEALEAIA